MKRGVALHAAGEYEDAALVRLEAFDIATPQSTEQGRAARDVAACYDRMGDADQAVNWATVAYGLHDAVVRTYSAPHRPALRERAASAMYVGAIGLRGSIVELQQGLLPSGTMPIDTLRHAQYDIRMARSLAPGQLDRRIDQYGINLARRLSIGETLLGDRSRGLIEGAKALVYAPMYESPWLGTSASELSMQQRFRAKAKAAAGAAAAIALGMVHSRKPGPRQQLTLKLASRTL